IGYASSGTADIEKAASLRPDLFIAPHRLPEIEEKLGKYGIPVLHVDFHTETNTQKSIEILGKATGKEERAKHLSDYYKKQTEKVAAALKGLSKKDRPSVYVETGCNKYNTYGPSYMFGAIVEKAGGSNIAKRAGMIKSGKVSAEFILKEDPDFIIFTGAAWVRDFGPGINGPLLGYYAGRKKAEETLREKINRPGWEELKAVKNGNVFGIFHGLSRHIYDFVCLQYFASWFHPEKCGEFNPELSWREFHEMFLPVTFSGTWAVRIKPRK
ncbi:MAG: ABC transporter substrate-binding protein, partial [Fibrobacterota bacterium]